ncbi:hypothetical protein C8Q74DRAFT_1373070 [Fomes fomentarius]|nr:hypothetical protein C8Q74DRAFT_1373070 [Fomes fomentarius]
MSSPTLIDDTNHIVQYQGGWDWYPQRENYVANTAHGLSEAGITATLGFTGTGIAVVGVLEVGSGRPTTKYSIDRQDVGTYTAPATGQTTYNVTFFSKRDLPRGNHDVVITFMDDTSPNRFWLDYFLVYDESSPPRNPAPVPVDSSTTVSSVGNFRPTATSTHTTAPPSETTRPTSTSTSQTSDSQISSRSLRPTASASTINPSSTVSDSSGSGSVSATESAGSLPESASPFFQTVTESPVVFTISPSSVPSASTTSSNHLPAIIGGIFGGLTLAILVVICLFVRRRRQARKREEALHATQPEGGAAQMSYNSTTVSRHATLSTSYATSAVHTSQSEIPSQNTDLSPTSHTSDGFAFSDPKSRLPIYGQSAPSGPGSSSAPSASWSDTHLLSPSSESTHSLVNSSPDTPLVHAEALRAPWHAPAGWNAQSLRRAFSSRNGRESPAPNRARDVDSGLRLYNEPALPPPYTPD